MTVTQSYSTTLTHEITKYEKRKRHEKHGEIGLCERKDHKSKEDNVQGRTENPVKHIRRSVLQNAPSLMFDSVLNTADVQSKNCTV